ncbi:hypothetical protein [Leptothoe spongobia]|uniref:Uncharacterized protein n=1 Tax=Leptothoe spongobia TAU-MAC 1115 TaxID=1967444 RepID=A0A947DJA7_9CYAN|nr:hypothetical protein [Leptothoe spongobia]MBT9317614.1 hypothetical protein [Leptothoe spongobia TAU-MAC 1115]
MAVFLKYALRLTGLAGLMGLMSCIPSGFAETSSPVGAQRLSALDLQPLEYRLDVPGRGQVVTTTITFTEFMDSEGFDYGAVVYLPTHDVESDFALIHHDLNGDDWEDVLVPLMVLPENEQDAKNEEDGYFALAVVLNQQGRPVHADTAFFGVVYEVALVNDQIVIQGAQELWGDEETFAYGWTTEGLAEINRVPLDLDAMPFPSDKFEYRKDDLENSRFMQAGAVDDPLALTQSLFGYVPEPNEETRRTNAVEVLETSDRRRVIGVTTKGGGDDSVYARRYRLVFVPDGDQWRIDWVGQQVSCYADRGRQAWHGDLCS